MKTPESSLFLTCVLGGLIVLLGAVSVYIHQYFNLRRNESTLFLQIKKSFNLLIGLITSFLAGYSAVLIVFSLHFEIDFNSLFGPILFLGALFVLTTAYLNNRMFSRLLKSRDALKKHAYQDYMTRLPNRRLLTEKINHAKEIAETINGKTFGVIFIDLLNFKKVNDSFGHHIGDKILIQAAQRIHAATNRATTSRIGGDDFVVLLENSSDSQSFHETRKIREKLLAPYSIDGFKFYLDASYGIFISGRESISADEIINRANMAMRRSKQRGKNTITIFNPAMQNSSYDALQFEKDFREALHEEQFELVYQPQFSITPKVELKGFEALVRWHHPKRGMVSPAEFIPLAEETGLIIDLDRYVLSHACSMWSSCLMEFEYCRKMHISVNLSAKHITEPALIKNIAKTLDEHDIPSETLYLELTESAFVSNPELASARLKALSKLGVQCAIDDFGTGYSSLAYLSNFPTRSLKIDKSFIDDLKTGDKAVKLVESIINLGHGMGIEVLAEGVEDSFQLETLCRLNCDMVQGFYLGRPMSLNDACNLIRKQSPTRLK